MAKGFRGGFGAKSGGGNNMQKLMQQAQAMQKEMEVEEAKEEESESEKDAMAIEKGKDGEEANKAKMEVEE